MARGGRYGSDSRTLFLVIRGILWGAVAGAVAVVMVEVLALITSGPSYFGTFIVVGGPIALVLGALFGVLVALVAWAVVRKHTDDAVQRAALTRVVGGASFVLSVLALLTAAIWFTVASQSEAQWWLIVALIVLGVGVPVAGLAIYAAGKVHDAMIVRFPRG